MERLAEKLEASEARVAELSAEVADLTEKVTIISGAFPTELLLLNGPRYRAHKAAWDDFKTRAEASEARVRALEEALCEVWDNYTDDRTLPPPLMEKVRDLIGIATPALGASNG